MKSPTIVQLEERTAVWCLDVDTPEDHADGVSEWSKLAAAHDPIVTREHRSATGGPHLIFTWSATLPIGCSKGALPSGIEVAVDPKQTRLLLERCEGVIEELRVLLGLGFLLGLGRIVLGVLREFRDLLLGGRLRFLIVDRLVVDPRDHIPLVQRVVGGRLGGARSCRAPSGRA